MILIFKFNPEDLVRIEADHVAVKVKEREGYYYAITGGIVTVKGDTLEDLNSGLAPTAGNYKSVLVGPRGGVSIC